MSYTVVDNIYLIVIRPILTFLFLSIFSLIIKGSSSWYPSLCPLGQKKCQQARNAKIEIPPPHPSNLASTPLSHNPLPKAAISSGGRCGDNCGSSTIFPATVYFPSGMYLVSGSIMQYYNTEILGNPLSWPIIVPSSSFTGLGVISSDFYTGEKTEWYINTNNFLRSIRNLIIDIRATPQDAQVCGIHWQVAQATSLENIMFVMTNPLENAATTQQVRLSSILD